MTFLLLLIQLALIVLKLDGIIDCPWVGVFAIPLTYLAVFMVFFMVFCVLTYFVELKEALEVFFRDYLGWK